MRALFPFFSQSHINTDITYLDSAATTHKLNSVIDATTLFYSQGYATVNRSSYDLAMAATSRYEATREAVKSFLGSHSSDQIIYTSGATQSINIIASGLQKSDLKGHRVLVMASEHHANLLPWQQLCQRFDLQLDVFTLSANACFDNDTRTRLLSAINDDIAIIAVAHVSNLLGNIYPVDAICEKAANCNAISVIDGTQAVAHLPIDVQSMQCDFYVCSAHKMYGPTGLGILYGKTSRLQRLSPSQFGGEMIKTASYQSFELQPSPLKFEAGTGNIAGIIGFEPAVVFLQENILNIQQHEIALYRYATRRLSEFEDIVTLGNDPFAVKEQASVGIIAFVHKHIATHDLVASLYQQNIAVRAGQHCAIPMMKTLGIESCVRLSLACYNNNADIDAFVRALSVSITLNDSTLQSSINSNIESHKKPHTLGAAANIDQDSKNKQAQHVRYAQIVYDAKGWDNKYRQLLLLSKHLEVLELEYRTEQYQVSGCESALWIMRDPFTQLTIANHQDTLTQIISEKRNALTLKAYSSSKVIRGILLLLIEKTQTLTLDQIVQFDFINYLDELGLSQYFSAGRRDGIANVIKEIKRLANIT